LTIFSLDSIIYRLESVALLEESMSKKILVADDSVVIQKSIGISFAQEDFQVTFVGNGEEAFQRAKEVKPDLILADTSMPKLSGAELCKKFRLDPDFRKTPIMLLASTQETYTAGQLKACGANDFIQKPFESSTLIEKVKGLFTTVPAEVSTSKSDSMEQSLDQTFSQSSAFAEEETAISKPPVQSPSPLDMDKSDDFAVDTISSFEPNPTPSPNTLASLDVLSLESSEELSPENSLEFAPYEEEQTKTVPANEVFSMKPASAPTPVATPASTSSAPSPATQLNLSEQQIEQIVSKVFQNVIERIAWEVVPEMAERLIKEELKKITEDK